MSDLFQFDETDFATTLDTGRLGEEINADPLLGSIFRSAKETPKPVGTGFRLRVRFTRDLTVPEEAALFAIVAAHPTPRPPGRTLARLDAMQPGVRAGRVMYARDARKAGEGTGAGTGALVYSDSVRWLLCRDDLAPQV